MSSALSTQHVMRHMSHFLFCFVFLQCGEAYWWRVCYQRGLSRLVLLKSSLFGDILGSLHNKAKAISAELLELNLKNKLEETGKTR